MPQLTYMQRMFIEYYLGKASGSAVVAARQAGYSCPETLGPRLARNPRIRAAIDARVGNTAAITASEILARIADIATADIMDFIQVEGEDVYKVNLKQIKEIGAGHVIRRLRINKDGTIQIELEPRLPALIKLGEYFKLWDREAESQFTLVDLAKSLKEKHERLRASGQYDQPAEALPPPAGAVP